jgi:hypothetical protein
MRLLPTNKQNTLSKIFQVVASSWRRVGGLSFKARRIMHISKTKLFANSSHINIMWMDFNVEIKHRKRQCHKRKSLLGLPSNAQVGMALSQSSQVGPLSL